MLETLRIRNYALIEEVDVDFRAGFNALTGETGAGKSIVVGALELVLGARASSDAVRAGADRATVDAVFRIQQLTPRLSQLFEEHEIPTEGGELLLQRGVGADGRSRAYANGQLLPISVLAAIGDELVDLHGQHEHQSLLKPDRQMDLLDGFGGVDKEVEALGALVGRLRALEREIAQAETDDRALARQVEFLRHEAGEIDKAGLEPGEEEEMRARRNVITNAETICTLAGGVCTALYDGEEGAAAQVLATAVRELGELAVIDSRFRPLLEQLEGCRATVEEIAHEVRGLGSVLEYDAEELERINSRLAMLSDLKRKYGADIAEILAYRDRARDQIEAYDRRDERLAARRKEQEALLAQAMSSARSVSGKRAAAAKKLDRQVSAALQDLGMKGARFETHIERGALTASGIDRVAFLLAANPGEPMKPLKLVASGGEVSRIMLALKAVFAGADRIPTLIFDEIDAGVGGTVAVRVAEKIHALSRTHQIICITHIPQIASVAQTHFHVSKSAQKKRTVTGVAAVTGEARVQEVARLLDGSLSELSMRHARELLAKAGN